MGMALLGELAAAGIISAEQLAAAAARHAAGDTGVVDAVAALVPVREAQPEVFTAAVKALFASAPPAPAAAAPRHADPAAPPGGAAGTVTLQLREGGAAPEPAAGEVAEAVCACVDVSGSMASPFEAPRDGVGREANRLEAVKQMFYGFRDQTQTFCEREGRRHLLGLLSYDNRVELHIAPSAAYDVFEDVVDVMRTKGMTAIYDAVADACAALEPVRRAHPGADLRALVLTDGMSNSGARSAQDALAELHRVGVVCDALIVGDRPDDDLLRLVSATDGIAFSVNSLCDAFETLESEAVVSLRARRGGAPRPTPKPRAAPPALRQQRQAALTVGAVAAAPPPRARPAVEAVAIGAWARAGGAAAAAGARKRAVKELRQLAGLLAAGDPLGDAYPRVRVGGYAADGASVDYVKATLRGAAGTPYAGGEWEVLIGLKNDYPFSAPTVRFETPIYHYAVSAEGRVCLPIILDEWAPPRTLQEVLQRLRELVMEPEAADPDCSLSLRSWLSELKRVSPAEYRANAVRHTQDHAAPAK